MAYHRAAAGPVGGRVHRAAVEPRAGELRWVRRDGWTRVRTGGNCAEARRWAPRRDAARAGALGALRVREGLGAARRAVHGSMAEASESDVPRLGLGPRAVTAAASAASTRGCRHCSTDHIDGRDPRGYRRGPRRQPRRAGLLGHRLDGDAGSGSTGRLSSHDGARPGSSASRPTGHATRRRRQRRRICPKPGYVRCQSSSPPIGRSAAASASVADSVDSCLTGASRAAPGPRTERPRPITKPGAMRPDAGRPRRHASSRRPLGERLRHDVIAGPSDGNWASSAWNEVGERRHERSPSPSCGEQVRHRPRPCIPAVPHVYWRHVMQKLKVLWKASSWSARPLRSSSPGHRPSPRQGGSS